VEHHELAGELSRRELVKIALKAGAYAAPVILAAGRPAPASAQVTGPTGLLDGKVRDANTLAPIAGATVTVGGLSTMTDSQGAYLFPNAPAGLQSVQSSAPGYVTQTDSVNITAGGATNHPVFLQPIPSDSDR